jgi:hypothetical protein
MSPVIHTEKCVRSLQESVDKNETEWDLQDGWRGAATSKIPEKNTPPQKKYGS